MIQIPLYTCADCGTQMVSTFVAGRVAGEDAIVTVKHPPTMSDCKEQGKTVVAPVRICDTDDPTRCGPGAYRA